MAGRQTELTASTKRKLKHLHEVSRRKVTVVETACTALPLSRGEKNRISAACLQQNCCPKARQEILFHTRDSRRDWRCVLCICMGFAGGFGQM